VFEILVREHADMLIAFLRSIVLQSDAVEDLFQESMLVAWRRLGDYDRSMPFGPWLRGIAVRLVLQHRRKTARGSLSRDPEVLQVLEEQYRRFELQPADSFRDRVERLARCMDRLPPLLRDAVDLVYGRGLTLRGLAASLAATEEAAKKRIQRARQLLAECVQGSVS
jgi:RNA polymerase sigma-70 factor (ECF subfamily)